MLTRVDHALESVARRLTVGCKILLGAIVATMFVVILAQVILRYFFDRGMPWPEELTVYLMAWMTFLGSAVALREGGHLRITMIVERFGERGMAFLNVLALSILLIFACVFMYLGWQMAYGSRNMQTTQLGISLLIPRLSMPVGGLMMAFYTTHSIVSALARFPRGEAGSPS